jgi:hypothetical protein
MDPKDSLSYSHKPDPDSVLSQMNSVLTVTPYLFQDDFNAKWDFMFSRRRVWRFYRPDDGGSFYDTTRRNISKDSHIRF